MYRSRDFYHISQEIPRDPPSGPKLKCFGRSLPTAKRASKIKRPRQEVTSHANSERCPVCCLVTLHEMKWFHDLDVDQSNRPFRFSTDMTDTLPFLLCGNRAMILYQTVRAVYHTKPCLSAWGKANSLSYHATWDASMIWTPLFIFDDMIWFHDFDAHRWNYPFDTAPTRHYFYLLSCCGVPWCFRCIRPSFEHRWVQEAPCDVVTKS